MTVVGCSGSYPGPTSPASCYLVEHQGRQVVLDLGNGALGPLQKYADMYDVDAVVLSHLHVDHFIDLCSYYVALKYRPDGPGKPLTVFGPRDTGNRLAAAYGSAPTADISAELSVRVLTREFAVGPFAITTTPVNHPIEAYAIRVEAGGKSVTYSGDTGPTDALVSAARDTDLALFEASFLSTRPNPDGLHLTGAQAARHAHLAGARSLLLTHLVPWNPVEEILAEARANYPEARVATPGMVVEL